MDEKADWVRVVISKGLNHHTLAAMHHAVGDPVGEPKYFIRVIQKKNGEIIDRHDGKHREDQNFMTWCLSSSCTG